MIDDPAASAVAPVPGFKGASPPGAAPAAHVPYGRRLWIAALAFAVLVTGGGLAFVYNDHLSSERANQALTTQNESLQGEILGLQGQLRVAQSTLSAAQSELQAAAAQVAHPHLGIWTVPESIQGPNYYLVGGIPDTFTYHLRLKSSGPMNVSIINFPQFGAASRCVDNGVGPVNWCMHHSGATRSWLGVKSVSFDFHLAEGCAGYLLVITAPGKVTVTPDVSVTYNPASHLTGTCA